MIYPPWLAINQFICSLLGVILITHSLALGWEFGLGLYLSVWAITPSVGYKML